MLTVYVLRKSNHLLIISLEFKWTKWKLSSILNYDWKNNESPEQESVKDYFEYQPLIKQPRMV